MATVLQNSFFAAPENLESLRLYSRTLRSFAAMSDSNLVVQTLLRIIELMISNADQFDEYCTSNIEWIGDTFMREVREFPNTPEEKKTEAITSNFTSAFRFLCELEFSQPVQPSFEIRKIGLFVDENFELFTGLDR